jgi:hypothetical protein
MEKLMTLDFLGMDTLSFLPVVVLRCHTLIMDKLAHSVKTAPVEDGDPPSRQTTWQR